MEDYTAEEQWPADKCLADVAACDLYVGLFAWRYGFIPPDNNPDNLSITELEYQKAGDAGRDRLIFLLDENAPWPRSMMDRDPGRIEDLRKRLSERHTCSFFTSSQNITDLAGPAVHIWAKESGRVKPGVLIPAFDLDAYFVAVSKRYQRLELEGLTQPHREEYLRLQLSNIFVEQSVREDRPPVELTKEAWDRLRVEREIHDEDSPAREFGLALDDLRRTREIYFEKPRRSVLDMITDPRYRRAVILGDPGSGKSTLARYALLSLIGPPHVIEADEKLRRAFPDHLPLLVELRSFAGLRADNKCDTFLEFLEYLGKTEGWGMNKDTLHEYLKNEGRAVVIFDGLDEIFDPEDRETVARQIIGFGLNYPKARVIVTSRIIGFPKNILETGGFTVFTLQDLDQGQVEQFVERWYSLAIADRPDDARARRERILSSFAESPSIRQLAGNPMLLTIMAIIGKHQELPRERWKLYDHAASVLIEHWDVNHHLRDHHLLASGADFIGEDEKKELLRRLAHRMQNGDGGLAGNFIHKTELEAEFESYLKDRFGKSPADATKIAREMIRQFRERNFILCFRGANSYGFIHRAFLEFFCASSFVHKFEKTREMSIEELKEQVFGAHWEKKEWREPLRLICGMINERFVGEIVDYLIAVEGQPRYFEYDRRPPWNIALAVQCLSELKNLDQVVEPAERLLKVICGLFDAARVLTLNLRLAPFNPRYLQNFDNFMKDEIASATENIGSNWPRCEWFIEWLSGYVSFDSSWTFSEAFGIFTGSVGASADAVHRTISNYVAGGDDQTRLVMIFALATGWKNGKQTAPLLSGFAVKDPSPNVRSAALSALAKNYRDAEGTLELLRDRAINDPEWLARRDALRALASNYRDAEGILELLRDRAINDQNESARRAALTTLATNYHDAEGTLELLHDRAINDQSAYARSAALAALATNYRDAEGTLELLCDRAINDQNAYARSAALTVLATNHHDAEGALELLRDCAVNDQDESARSDALSALATNYCGAAGTLELLRDRAISDQDAYARSAALSALATNYRDAEGILELLRDRAVNDQGASARRAALTTLVTNYHGAEGTLELLRDRAVNDQHVSARSDALSALATNYRDAEGTLELLCDRAINDPEWLARSAALSALATNYRDAAGTFELLRDRAVNDQNASVRSDALSALATNYRDAEETLELLRDRAVNDQDAYAKSDALSALARNYRDAAGTFEL